MLYIICLMSTLIVKCLGCQSDVYAYNCRYRCMNCGFEGGWAEVTSQDGPNKRRESEAKEQEETDKQRYDRGDKLLRTEVGIVSSSSTEPIKSVRPLHYVQKTEQEVWEIYTKKG